MEKDGCWLNDKPKFVSVGDNTIISIDLISSIEKTCHDEEYVIYLNTTTNTSTEVYFDTEEELKAEFDRVTAILTK